MGLIIFRASNSVKRLQIALQIFSFSLFVSCSLSDQQLKKGWWKYGEGYHIGDIIDFQNNSSLNKDTIIKDGKRVAIITARRKGLFGDDNEIEIQSLNGKEIGIYHHK